jgi:hypothetical protein
MDGWMAEADACSAALSCGRAAGQGEVAMPFCWEQMPPCGAAGATSLVGTECRVQLHSVMPGVRVHSRMSCRVQGTVHACMSPAPWRNFFK